MSSYLDPYFLFSHQGNRVALAQLLDSEKFKTIKVKPTINLCNNTIALLEILREDLDEDDLPIIVSTGIQREIHYDREDLNAAFHKVLSQDHHGRHVVKVPANFYLETDDVVAALIANGINVGNNAIEIYRIGTSEVIHISTTDKSIRFKGSARIVLHTN